MCRRLLVLFSLNLWLVLGGVGLVLVSLLEAPAQALPVLAGPGRGRPGRHPGHCLLQHGPGSPTGPAGARADQCRRAHRAGPTGQRVFLSSTDELGELGQTLNRLSERAWPFASASWRRTGSNWRTILSGMVEGVVPLDAEQRILFANERANQLLEFPPNRSAGTCGKWCVSGRCSISCGAPGSPRTVPRGVQLERQRGSDPDGPCRPDAALPALPARGGGTRGPGDKACARRPPGAVLVLHDTTELRRLERLRQSSPTSPTS